MHHTMHIPVILLSTSPKIKEIAENCNADGFIRKPFDLDNLVDEVKNHLN
jgi:response regulator RpfG family c-di-GMP phosphodiesterase